MITRIIVILMLVLAAPAQAKQTTVVVGIDASNSAPVLQPEFAQRAGQFVADRIASLSLGDTVKLQTFGEFAASDSRVSEQWRLTKKAKPNAVAIAVGNFIASIPSQIEEGQLRPQKQTALLAWMHNMARVHPCQTESTHFVIVSDGLTYESMANAYELIKTGSGQLPTPNSGLFDGCRLTIVGFGRGSDGLNAVLVERLRSIWEGWANSAGMAEPRLLNDW